MSHQHCLFLEIIEININMFIIIILLRLLILIKLYNIYQLNCHYYNLLQLTLIQNNNYEKTARTFFTKNKSARFLSDIFQTLFKFSKLVQEVWWQPWFIFFNYSENNEKVLGRSSRKNNQRGTLSSFIKWLWTLWIPFISFFLNWRQLVKC